jgi:peptidoglycan/xylan/chitin deacetylase (PgdA/CDA1 family)
MKPTLMIHEFKEEYLDLPLENYVLTFDDGLYSQYAYIDELQKLNTQKIFFISSNIVCPEDHTQDMSLIYCRDAHERAFSGDCRNYMKWSQIAHIDSLHQCQIGCHGHKHIYDIISNPITMLKDSRRMTQTFQCHLGYVPDSFCFPYNIESIVYKTILQKYGLKHFYGGERIDIDDL